MTSDGLRGHSSAKAILTQSTGVPLHEYHVTSPPPCCGAEKGVSVSGVSEKARERPERGPSGAQTMTVPRGLTMRTSSVMPLAVMPSSFEMSIKGFSIILCFVLSDTVVRGREGALWGRHRGMAVGPVWLGCGALRPGKSVGETMDDACRMMQRIEEKWVARHRPMASTSVILLQK